MALPRILAAAALLLALALPATAGAASSHTALRQAAPAKALSPVDAANRIGLRHWGATPCNGQVKVVARRAVPAGLAPDADAWVTFDSPAGANNLAGPAGSYTNCTVSLARWRWPTTASMREDWDMLCATMTHELGHLLGKVHESTAGNVMAPVFTDHSGVPPLCRSNRPSRSARSAR